MMLDYMVLVENLARVLVNLERNMIFYMWRKAED